MSHTNIIIEADELLRATAEEPADPQVEELWEPIEWLEEQAAALHDGE